MGTYGVLFLDLCKAFDTVDHAILLRKLSIYGIHDKALKWFKSYLLHRAQYCKVHFMVIGNNQTLIKK